MSLLFKPFLTDGSQCGGRSFQVKTKQPFLFFLPPAMDPWKESSRDNLTISALTRMP